VHLTNAYDDGEDVVVELVRFDCEWDQFRSQVRVNQPQAPQFPPSRLMQYRITTAGTVIERELTSTTGEFPQYDWRRGTRRHNYSYLAAQGPTSTGLNQILEVDHRTGTTTAYDFGLASVGEPLFVPRSPDAAEDDGWLLFLNHDLTENLSQLVILDARDLEHGPLATAWLNHRVPWGFHGTFNPPHRQHHGTGPRTRGPSDQLGSSTLTATTAVPVPTDGSSAPARFGR